MMNPFSYLALRYKNCSIHVKLFASCFLLIFIPIIALTMFATYQSTKIIEKQSMEITGLYLQQTENELESELNRLATISSSVAQLSDVHEVLEKQDSNISFSEEYDDINALYKTIESTRTLYGVYQIRHAGVFAAEHISSAAVEAAGGSVRCHAHSQSQGYQHGPRCGARGYFEKRCIKHAAPWQLHRTERGLSCRRKPQYHLRCGQLSDAFR